MGLIEIPRIETQKDLFDALNLIYEDADSKNLWDFSGLARTYTHKAIEALRGDLEEKEEAEKNG